MITLPSGDLRLTRLLDKIVTPVLLVDLTIGSDTFRMTESVEDIVVDGNTYSPEPSLTGTTFPQHSLTPGDDSWTFEFAEPNRTDNDADDPPQWRERISGASETATTVIVSVVFADENGRNHSPRLQLFSGGASAMRTVASPADAGRTTIEFVGNLARADNQIPRQTTTENQHLYDNTDTCFDFANLSEERSVFWGLGRNG